MITKLKIVVFKKNENLILSNLKFLKIISFLLLYLKIKIFLLSQKFFSVIFKIKKNLYLESLKNKKNH